MMISFWVTILCRVLYSDILQEYSVYIFRLAELVHVTAEIVFIIRRFEVIWLVIAMEGGEGIGLDQSQWEL